MKLFSVTGVNIEKLKLPHVWLDDMSLISACFPEYNLPDSFHLFQGWNGSWTHPGPPASPGTDFFLFPNCYNLNLI